MRLAVALVMLAACGDSNPGSPDSKLAVKGPLASATVALSDPTIWNRLDGQLIVPDLLFEAIVQCPNCASQVITGTFGGVTYTGNRMYYKPPAMGAAVFMDRPPAGATTLTLHTDDPADGSITVTLPDGVFEPRTLTIEGGSTSLCPGQSVTLDWSQPADLRGGQTTVDWGVRMLCGLPGGCEGFSPPLFEEPATVSSTIVFMVPTPSHTHTMTSGVLTTTPLAAPDTGNAPCDAQACTYSAQHTAQTPASWQNSCLQL